jgi:hypothetical protein
VSPTTLTFKSKPTFEEAVHHSRLRLQNIGTNLNKITEQLKCSANVRDIAMSDIGATVHCSAYETHNTTLQKSVDERFGLESPIQNQAAGFLNAGRLSSSHRPTRARWRRYPCRSFGMANHRWMMRRPRRCQSRPRAIVVAGTAALSVSVVPGFPNQEW